MAQKKSLTPEELKNQFIQNALQFAQARDKRTVQVWENFLNIFQKDGHADEVCLEIIHTHGDTAALTAAYSLRTICRKRLVSENLSNKILQTISDFQNKQLRSHQPVFIQLCLAYAATFALSFVEQFEKLSKTQVALDVNNYMQIISQMIFTELINKMVQCGISMENQLTIIGCIPEHSIIKDLKHAISFQGAQKQSILEQLQFAILSVSPFLIEQIFTPYLASSITSPGIITQYGGSYHRLLSNVVVHWLKYSEQMIQTLLLLQQNNPQPTNDSQFHTIKQTGGKGKASKITEDITVLSSNNFKILFANMNAWLQSSIFSSCFQALELLFQADLLHDNQEEIAALIGYVSEMIVHIGENLIGLSTLVKQQGYRFPQDDEIMNGLWNICIEILLKFTTILQTVTLPTDFLQEWQSATTDNSSRNDNVYEILLEKLAYYTNFGMMLSESIVPVFQAMQAVTPKYMVMLSSDTTKKSEEERRFLNTFHAFLQQFDCHVQIHATMMTFITSARNTKVGFDIDGESFDEERLEILHDLRDIMGTYMHVWSEYSKLVVDWNNQGSAEYSRRKLEGNLITLEYLWKAVVVVIHCSEFEQSFDLLDTSYHAVILHYLDEMAEYRCHLRDFLRDVITAQPITMKLLLFTCKDHVKDFIQRQQQLLDQNWIKVEAVLHAFSAVGKEIFIYLTEAQDGECFSALQELLNDLISTPHCRDNRGICRISLVPIAEIITYSLDNGLLSLNEQNHITLIESYFGFIFRALHYQENYLSLLTHLQRHQDIHSLHKISIEAGGYIPFCLKQDHIAAVTVYRLFLSACSAIKKPNGQSGHHELLSLILRSNHFVQIVVHMMLFVANKYSAIDPHINGLRVTSCIQQAQSIGLFQQNNNESITSTFFTQLLEYFFQTLFIGPYHREKHILSWPSFSVIVQGVIHLAQDLFFSASPAAKELGLESFLYFFLGPALMSSLEHLETLQQQAQRPLQSSIPAATNAVLSLAIRNIQQCSPALPTVCWNLLADSFITWSLIFTKHLSLQVVLSLIIEIMESITHNYPRETLCFASLQLLELLMTWFIALMSEDTLQLEIRFSDAELTLLEDCFHRIGTLLHEIFSFFASSSTISMEEQARRQQLFSCVESSFFAIIQQFVTRYMLYAKYIVRLPSSIILQALLQLTAIEYFQVHHSEEVFRALQALQGQCMEQISILGMQITVCEFSPTHVSDTTSSNHRQKGRFGNNSGEDNSTSQQQHTLLNVFKVGVERESKSQLKKGEELQSRKNLMSLLDSWCVACSPPLTSSTATRFGYWQYWSWSIIETMIDFLYEHGSKQFCNFHRIQSSVVWKQILQCVKLLSGPIVLLLPDAQGNPQPTEVSIAILIENKATCSAQPSGHPDLMALYFAPLQQHQSSSMNSVQKLLAMLIRSVYFNGIPPVLREEVIQLFAHLFFVFGANYTAQCIYENLLSQGTYIFGMEASQQSKAQTVGTQLHTAALAGDWKRFRSVLKILSKQ